MTKNYQNERLVHSTHSKTLKVRSKKNLRTLEANVFKRTLTNQLSQSFEVLDLLE